VQESAVAVGSSLANIECTDSDGDGTPSAGDLNAATAVVHLDPGETVECTFTNAQATVRIIESYTVSRVEEGKLTGEGSVACYWVTLSGPPVSGNVVVDVGPVQNGEVTVNKTSVILDGSNWDNLTTANRSNFVCIRPIDDNVADGGTEVCRNGNDDIIGNGTLVVDKECGDHTDAIPHAVASSTAPGFDTNTPIVRKAPDGSFTQPSTIDVLVQDNDQVGVVLTESFAVSDLDEDGAPVNLACYWVNLTSQPIAPVTVKAAASKVNLSASEVTLDASNWDALDASVKSNRLCVTPINNSIVEPGGPFCATKNSEIFGTGADAGTVCGDYLAPVSHTVTSGDGAYDGTTNIVTNGPNLDNDPTTVDVLVRNDDVAALNIQPAILNLLEGSTLNYSVALTAEPNGEVTVDNGQEQQRFDNTDWNQPKSFTVTAPENSTADGTRQTTIQHRVTSATDTNYQALAPTPVQVTIVDNDSAGVLLSTAEVTAPESGAQASYDVRLTSRPTGDVTVTLLADDQVTATPSELTFTPANWDLAQSVTVAAVDDALVEAAEHLGAIRHEVSSSDGDYSAIAVSDLSVRIDDNDTAELLLTDAQGMSVSEAGGSTSYSLRLSGKPNADVTVRLSSQGQLSLNPATVLFTPANWDAAQTVTVTAVDDAVAEGATHGGMLSHSVSSADPAFADLVVDDVVVAIEDNDAVGLAIEPTALELGAGEAGSYTVVLASQPRAEVVVRLQPASGLSLDAASCDEGGQCLRFTPETWNGVQTVTVAADATAEAASIIGHSVASSDRAYDGVAASNVSVTLLEPGSGAIFLPIIQR
jgi:hypothetical protein